jgi:hypothetical protein
MKLLFVHGRSQGGKDPVKLQSEWLSALTAGLEKANLSLPPSVQIDFPFYGDRLDQLAQAFDLPADPAVLPKGSPAFDEFAAFKADVAAEMQRKAGISDEQVQAECRTDSTEKGVQNWAWVQAVIRLLDRQLTGISQTTIEVFLRDVFLYTHRDVVRNAINQIVSQKMSADTAVVIGHSLGSIVAYNLLRAASKRVPLFVTVGSPLAIRAVRNTLGPITNPAGSGWYNAYDKRDIVALYPLDQNNFSVDPAITNNGNVDNRTDNRHGIIGYLDDVVVAKTIYSGLR